MLVFSGSWAETTPLIYHRLSLKLKYIKPEPPSRSPGKSESMRIILLLKKINKHECETNPHTQNETILTPARFTADFVARKQFLQRIGRQIGATFVIQVRDVAHFNIPVLPSRMPELVPVLKNNLTASKSVTTFHLSGFEEQETSLSASDSFCTYFQQWRRVVPVNTYGYGFISSEVGSQFDDGDIAVPHASFVSAVEEYISFLYLHKKVTRFSRFLFSNEQNRHENFFLDKRNVLKAKRNVRKTKKIGFVGFFFNFKHYQTVSRYLTFGKFLFVCLSSFFGDT